MKRIDQWFKKIGSKIKFFLLNFIDCKKSIISFSLALFSSICLLISGTTNSDTNIYKSASYIAELLNQSGDADHLAIVVEQKENGVVPDTATELRGLYGAFGNRESNYAGTINASKDRDISFIDFEQDKRLSFVYVQTGVQVSNKIDEKGNVHHRMEFYPLELMFEFFPNSPTSFYSFLYLSTSQARKLIDIKYPGMFSSADSLEKLLSDDLFVLKCRELLGTGIDVKFNETVKNFEITNIYYEKDYFFNIVSNTIGEFLVGYNQYPEGFQKQATYFLNKYEYQSKFYLEYIKERYTKRNSNFDVSSILINSKIDKSKVLSSLDYTSNVFSVVMLMLSIVLLLAMFFFMFRYKLFNLTFVFYTYISFITPYILGFIIWKISKNLAFFSPFFTTGVLIILIITSIFFVCYYSIDKWKNRKG